MHWLWLGIVSGRCQEDRSCCGSSLSTLPYGLERRSSALAQQNPDEPRIYAWEGRTSTPTTTSPQAADGFCLTHEARHQPAVVTECQSDCSVH